jgi:hypothetical protein
MRWANTSGASESRWEQPTAKPSKAHQTGRRAAASIRTNLALENITTAPFGKRGIPPRRSRLTGLIGSTGKEVETEWSDCADGDNCASWDKALVAFDIAES